MGNGISRKWIALGFLASASAVAAPKIHRTVEHVNGEVLVKLRESGAHCQTQASTMMALKKALGDNSVVRIQALKTDSSLNVIRLAKDQDLKKALQTLKSSSLVRYAEPNYIYRAFDDGTAPADPFPNDVDFNKLWGLSNTGQVDAAGQKGLLGSDIHVMPVWQEGFTGSRNVLVAVIDTGIDWTHP